jgi:hypothetical protein
MNAVTVRVRGKRGVVTLPNNIGSSPLLDRAATDFERVFAVGVTQEREEHRVVASSPPTHTSTASSHSRTHAVEVAEVRDLMKRLRRALEQQANATSSVNRTTIKNRAGKLRKALRLLGVENPPDRSNIQNMTNPEKQK